jgi:hypothetical protein
MRASGTERATKRERSEASLSEAPEGTAAKPRRRAPIKDDRGLRFGPSTLDEQWPRALTPPGSGDGEPAFLADEAGGQPAGTGG